VSEFVAIIGNVGDDGVLILVTIKIGT